MSGRRWTPARVLALYIAASIALHVVVLLGFPAIGRRNAPPIEPIEVTLSKPQRIAAPPPPVLKPEPRKAERARSEVEPRRAQSAARVGVSPPVPEPPLLALPQTPLAQTPLARTPLAQTPPAQTPLAQTPVGKPESVRPPDAKAEVSARAEASPSAKPEVAAVSPPAAPAPAAKAARSEVRDAALVDSSVRYPRTAEKGRVTLKVLVTREGRASTVNLEKSSGHANLDQHALQAVRRWRFAPARQGNEPVEQWMTVNVDY